MDFFCRLLTYFSLVSITLVLQIKASNVECVNRLVEICNNARYSDSSLLDVFSTDITNGRKVNVRCHSDGSGTTCYQNQQIWFSCTPDHTATYKGRILSVNSADGVDDEVCYIADKLNSSTRKSTMNQEMPKKFPDCFPFCDHNPFRKGFPFNRRRFS